MFTELIEKDSSPEDWGRIREKIRSTIWQSMGTFPRKPDITPEFGKQGTLRQGIRPGSVSFQSYSGWTINGAVLYPKEYKPGKRFPAVLCLHETDPLGHAAMIDPDARPDRAYAFELASRGYITMSVDQYGFGKEFTGQTIKQYAENFYREYPKWSLDGMRLAIHQQALDILITIEGVDPNRLGCIGHSLGGRAGIYLAALDERIQAAVLSAGISPHVTNAYRDLTIPDVLSPVLREHHIRTGSPLFEYHEIMALCAPRFLMVLEAWNDLYNLSIEAVFQCFEKAKRVYALLGKHENLQMLCHGDGHDTRKELREYAYLLMDRKLQERS